MKNCLLFFSVLVFIFSSCSNEKQEQDPQLIPEEKQELTKYMPKDEDSADTNQEEIIRNQLGKKALAPKILMTFLPDKIPGAETIAPNMGVQSYGDNIWSSASGEYIFDRGGIIVTIEDYGFEANIPENVKEAFSVLPEKAADIVEEINVNQGSGYMTWNPNARTGNVFMIIKNRFTIRIEVVGLSADFNNPASLADFIDITKLIQFAEAKSE